MRVRLMIAAAAAALLVGCFNPSVKECGVTCNTARECPSGSVCLSDGFCHNSADETLCAVTFDAAPPDAPLACGNGIIEGGMGEECDDGGRDSGDGCSNACQFEAGFVCVDQPSICRRVPSMAGELVITELMINPAAVMDFSGEWVEIHNPTAEDFDLQGLSLVDPDIEGETFTVNTSAPLMAGGHIVLGVSTNMATNGGAPVDLAYGNAPQLANGADNLQIRNDTIVIDAVSWSVPPQGASFSLSAATYDAVGNDDTGNFCDGAGVFGDGDLGTPGVMNPPCP